MKRFPSFHGSMVANDPSVSPPSKQRRRTRQQAIISETFYDQTRPISLDKLHQLVTEKEPKIAYSTVYRWLQKMHDEGLTASIAIARQPARYEPVEHHCNQHFYCRRCDELYRLKGTPPDLESIESPAGLVESYQIVFYGVCDGCMRFDLRESLMA